MIHPDYRTPVGMEPSRALSEDFYPLPGLVGQRMPRPDAASRTHSDNSSPSSWSGAISVPFVMAVGARKACGSWSQTVRLPLRW